MIDKFDLCVSICTFSRAPLLKRTLQSLEQVTKLSDIKWELLIIDNGLDNKTKAVVEEFSNKLPINYVEEPRKGLSCARNRAISSAQSDFIIFTDDDTDIAPKWLEAYRDVLQKYPNVAFIGGKILPAWQENPPYWVKRFASTWLAGVIVSYNAGDKEWIFDRTRESFFGANFGVRTNLVKEIGGFNENLGHIGKKQLGSEETQLFDKLMEKGYFGVYSPNAIVYHRIESYRWKRSFIFKNFFGQGLAEIIRKPYKNDLLWLIFFKKYFLIFIWLVRYILGELIFCPRIWLSSLSRLAYLLGECSQMRRR